MYKTCQKATKLTGDNIELLSRDEKCVKLQGEGHENKNFIQCERSCYQDTTFVI